MENKHYVIQRRRYSGESVWDNHSRRFDTLEEAKAHAKLMGYNLEGNFRIAESYVQVRYKAVKE